MGTQQSVSVRDENRAILNDIRYVLKEKIEYSRYFIENSFQRYLRCSSEDKVTHKEVIEYHGGTIFRIGFDRYSPTFVTYSLAFQKLDDDYNYRLVYFRQHYFVNTKAYYYSFYFFGEKLIYMKAKGEDYAVSPPNPFYVKVLPDGTFETFIHDRFL